jgi:hypothetical protein
VLEYWNAGKVYQGMFHRYFIIPSLRHPNTPGFCHTTTPLFYGWVLVAVVPMVRIIPAIRVRAIVAITIWSAVESVAFIVTITDGVAIPATVVYTASEEHGHQ